MTAAGLVLLAVTLFSYAASATWLGELTTHFRPHLAAASIAVLLGGAILRSRVGVLAGIIAAGANLLPLLPYLGAPDEPGRGDAFRILALNLHGDESDYGAVERLIGEQSPDLVVLTEAGRGVGRLVERLRATLPTVLVSGRRGSFETLLLSTWRAEEHRIDRDAGRYFPVTRARLCREKCVSIVALHAMRPLEYRGVFRAQQFEIAARLAAEDAATVVVGDLNCTPWSPLFSRLLGSAGLRDGARGHSLSATWLHWLPIIGLPIDHVLVGRAIGVGSHRVGPDVGSDHYPVIAELILRED